MNTPSSNLLAEQARKRTRTGLLLLVIGLAVAAAAATGAVPYSLARTPAESIYSGTPTWITVLGCLIPVAGLANLVGALLIAAYSARISRPHQISAWLGTAGLLAPLLISLVVILPISASSATRGNLSQALLALWLGVLNTSLSAAGYTLLPFNLVKPSMRITLIVLAVLQAVQALASAFVAASGFKIVDVVISGQKFFIPTPFTGGIYPALQIAALALSWILAIVYLFIYLDWNEQK